ncbi:uncharacterized protein [Anabrus simplex]|uniref:uncharacterized protein n=1 Tax=Anabrus simplex TaxID=316456 RepID=UPI0035A28687
MDKSSGQSRIPVFSIRPGVTSQRELPTSRTGLRIPAKIQSSRNAKHREVDASRDGSCQQKLPEPESKFDIENRTFTVASDNNESVQQNPQQSTQGSSNTTVVLSQPSYNITYEIADRSVLHGRASANDSCDADQCDSTIIACGIGGTGFTLHSGQSVPSDTTVIIGSNSAVSRTPKSKSVPSDTTVILGNDSIVSRTPKSKSVPSDTTVILRNDSIVSRTPKSKSVPSDTTVIPGSDSSVSSTPNTILQAHNITYGVQHGHKAELDANDDSVTGDSVAGHQIPVIESLSGQCEPNNANESCVLSRVYRPTKSGYNSTSDDAKINNASYNIADLSSHNEQRTSEIHTWGTPQRYSCMKPRRVLISPHETQKRPRNLILFSENESPNPKGVKQVTTQRPRTPSTINSPIEELDLWKPKETSTPEMNEDHSSSLHLGQKVCVGQAKVGVLRYLGPLHGEPGVWCGVELDEPAGLNDGSVRGTRYFQCRAQHGVFAPIAKITPARNTRRSLRRGTFTVSHTVNSGPFSLLAGLQQQQQQQPGSLSTSTETDDENKVQTPGSAQTMTDWADPQLSKQSSIEQDESLGILTPDQMTMDFTGYNCSPKTLFAGLDQDGAAGDTLVSNGTSHESVLNRSGTGNERGDTGAQAIGPGAALEKYITMGNDVTFLDHITFSGFENAMQDPLLDDFHGLKSPDLTDEPPVRAGTERDFPPPVAKLDAVKAMSDAEWKAKYLAMASEATLLDQISFSGLEANLLDSLVDDSYGLKSPDLIDVAVVKAGSEPDYTPPSPRMDFSERTLSPEDLPVDTPLQEDARPLTDAEKTDEVSEMTGPLSVHAPVHCTAQGGDDDFARLTRVQTPTPLSLHLSHPFGLSLPSPSSLILPSLRNVYVR